jgi:simple sugar transport system substrate-binding protein
MKVFKTIAAVAALSTGTATFAQEPLDIAFTVHADSANVFWQTVQKGFEDACARIEANCQMIYMPAGGGLEGQVANMEAAIARVPDGLITSIVDNVMFDDVIQRAQDAGIVVIAANVDDLEGAAGNARLAFVGQGFVPAGYNLMQKLWESMPADGPIHVVVGVNAPGQNWSEQRGLGIINFLDEMIAANPDRQITYEKIDSGLGGDVVSERVGAYLLARPDTTAYLDTAIWQADVALVLIDRGVPPGQVLLAGFDVVPVVLDRMREGYVQVTVDQQPYMQGFMPVMQIYLAKIAGLTPSDIDTGSGLVTPDQVDQIMSLSEQGLR